MSARASIVLFRQDLRLGDNPALTQATAKGGPVIPLYIWSPEEEGGWPPGAASRWWLHGSLLSLREELARAGASFVIRRGPILPALIAVARESGADAVFWNRRYEPAAIARDTKLRETLQAEGLHPQSFNGALLREPWTLLNQSGKPFQVFSAYWRAFLKDWRPEAALSARRKLGAFRGTISSLPLEELGLLPRMGWAAGLRGNWSPGASGAWAELKRFLDGGYTRYAEGRDEPHTAGTSRLSPHLHFGEISPRQVWEAILTRRGGTADTGRGSFFSELGWREFAHNLLYHFPRTPEEPLRAEFSSFPWKENKALLGAWQRGHTGYPLVDAGMRELWATGWMHNRVRMVVASFLVKNLLQPWQAGARWFWDTLVDADLANNTMGWQWSAGCGADAAPYFRIFNPVSQGEKFDPEGTYVRRWVPDLAGLPKQYIHKPWQAPPGVLEAAGVKLGSSYPEPVVSLFASRETALDAYARMKTQRKRSAPD